MGRSLQPTVTTGPSLPVSLPKLGTLHLVLGSQRSQAWPIYLLKSTAAPPASTLAGGSSLTFLPLHSLPRATARGIFLKGKADLVSVLPKFFHEQHQAQQTRRSSGCISSKYKLGMELRAGYLTSSSHTYLTGILRSICIMGKMPGIPLSPENQSRACSRAPKAFPIAHPISPDLSPSLHTQSLPRSL